MIILIAGDFCERYRVEDQLRHKAYKSLFGQIMPLLSDADYSIVNFEMPIAEGNGRPICKCGPCLKGSSAAIDALKYAGFSCCTLANNHTLDQGEQCGLNTKALIEKAGLDTVGFGKDENDAAQTLYKQIGEETLAVINCCEHEFSVATRETAGTNGLNPVRQYRAIQEARENADYVVVIVHGGHEHVQLPSVRMKELYRFFIEAGADAVVNHHQHCYSGYEYYWGKPIVYGTGNFCFDDKGHRNSTWNEGYIAALELTKSGCGLTLHPYVQCNEAAEVRNMTNEETLRFEQRLAEMNRLIEDDGLLLACLEHEYEKSVIYELSLIEPYRSRIALKLMNMGLLPRFMKRMKKTALLNHVCCESHRDRLIYALNKKDK